MSRRPLIVGNWKMNLGSAQAVGLARDIKRRMATLYAGPETAVCPSFPHLSLVGAALEGSVIGLGAQDLAAQRPGPFTGAVSPEQLKELGVRFVLIGHSERRQFFGETDTSVAEKIQAAFRAGLAPIVCFGETLDERQQGKTEEVVVRQVTAAIGDLSSPQQAALVLAYEPVWAIGTGANADVDDADEVHRLARGLLQEAAGDAVAQTVRILYGGSVKPSNAGGYLARADIDGALVGGASLEAESFVDIVCYQDGGR